MFSQSTFGGNSRVVGEEPLERLWHLVLVELLYRGLEAVAVAGGVGADHSGKKKKRISNYSKEEVLKGFLKEG